MSGTRYLPQRPCIDGMPILDPKGVLFGWSAPYGSLGRVCHFCRQRFTQLLSSQKKRSRIILWSYEVNSSSQAVIQCAAAPVTACFQSQSAFFRHFKNRILLYLCMLEKYDLLTFYSLTDWSELFLTVTRFNRLAFAKTGIIVGPCKPTHSVTLCC